MVSKPVSAQSTNVIVRCSAGLSLTFLHTQPFVECSLPASTECLIKLHQALVLVASRLGKSKLGTKQRSLPIEDLEIGGDTSTIAHQGRVDGILQIFNCCLLRDADFMNLLITDQCIGDIAKRQLNGLLICDQFLPMLRLRQFQIPAESAARENWLSDLGAIGPDSSL